MTTHDVGRGFLESEARLCAGVEIECAGKCFKPNATLAFAECFFAHSYPATTFYGVALYHEVLERSFETMLHQKVDLDHAVRIYDPDRIRADQIVGSVVAVELDRGPWRDGSRLPSSGETPRIRAVLVLYKQAQRMSRVLGDHLTQRRVFTVSMEYMHRYADNVFAVPSECGLVGDVEHRGFSSAGQTLISWAKAPEELKACFVPGSQVQAFRSKGKSFTPTMLAGGLSGGVDFEGVGLVGAGAEPTAQVGLMAASRPALEGQERIDALNSMWEAIQAHSK